MQRRGVGTRTGREMGHLAQSGPGGMLEVLEGLPRQRKVLIHINNTNPILLADSAIVGHLGTEALAALGVASSILLTATGVFVFLAYGTTSVVARRLGSGDETGAVAAGVDGLWLSVALGAVAGVGMAVAAPWLCAAIGGSPGVQEQATIYLRISAIGIPGMLLVLGATETGRRRALAAAPLDVDWTWPPRGLRAL